MVPEGPGGEAEGEQAEQAQSSASQACELPGCRRGCGPGPGPGSLPVRRAQCLPVGSP